MRRFATSLSAIVLCSLTLGAASAYAAAPTIPRVAVTGVTTGSATLEAEINPQEKATSYHFEYGPADCASNPCTSIPSPKEGVVKAGNAAVLVTASLEGLPAGTSYHYRVVAHNSEGELKSPDRLFATYSPPQAFEPCPNDSFRDKGAGAALPDCRAYEQASPVNKNGGDVTNTTPFIATSEDGNAVTFLSDAGVPGGEGSQELPYYLSSRANGSWSTQGLLPPGSTGEVARVIGWQPDLSQVFDIATKLGEPQRTTFLARSSSGGALSTLFPYTANAEYFYVGASSDGSLVFFETGALKGGIGKSSVYAWDRESGELSLVDVMNDGTPPAKGAFAGSYGWVDGVSPQSLSRGGALSNYYTQDQHVISADGSAVYFTASGSGQLYVRLNPTAEQSPLSGAGECLDPELACTIRVGVSRRTVPDPVGSAPVAFQAASVDGTKSFLTSTEKLTDDANTGPERPPAAIARADIDGKPASVDPTFIPTHASGVAVDGAHVYWVDTEKETIGRAKLDGSAVDDQFITATEGTRGLAVGGGYIYWTNGGCEPDKCIPEGKGEDGTIGRAKLNGDEAASEVKGDFISGVRNPWAVAVNADNVYWTSSALTNGPDSSIPGGDKRPLAFIARANLEGEEVEGKFLEVFSNGTRLPGIALDGSHIYWMQTDPLDQSVISRADLDGGHYIITFIFVAHGQEDSRETHGRGVAVDGSHIYWSSQGTSEIGRAKLNGEEGVSETELEFIKDANHPQGLAVDSTHIYWGANAEALPNAGNDLYRYDAKTDQLSDLVPDPGDANGAEVRGVLGASDDGSYVYFAANGDLDGSGPATPGSCSGAFLQGSGTCNLYLWHEGEIRFVARIGGNEKDAANWAMTTLGTLNVYQRSSRLTPDGRTLLFSSQRKLTAYENEGVTELYRYYAPDESLLCVSCNPSGEAPPKIIDHLGGIATKAPGFGSISPAVLMPRGPASVLSHVLSDDGKRVFFETVDALVGADTNYQFTDAEGRHCPTVGGYLNFFPVCLDVYEWEAQGAGSCKAPGGCIYLLSTGTEEEASLFAGASASGNDVFIYARSKLVGQDTDVQRDVYDMRVDGGLASQYPQPKKECEGEGCKGGSSPPPGSETAGSAAFAGPPNPKPNHGHKKARHKRKKHHKRHRRAHAERRAQR